MTSRPPAPPPITNTPTDRLSAALPIFLPKISKIRRRRPRAIVHLAAVLLTLTHPAIAAEALVAVATNFLTTAQNLAETFEQETGHQITLASGATGKLTAQITRGAPFDLFLAADTDRPARLIAEGHALPPQIPYATGTLTLWSKTPKSLDAIARTPPRRFAIANPALAPYGRAAQEAIQSLGWDTALKKRLVQGQNVGQTFALIATGAAPMGLISTAACMERKDICIHALPIDKTTHSPIRQTAVLTKHGQDNPAAKAFLTYLTSPHARARITAAGYGAE